MIPISKRERKDLVEKYGVETGEYGISRTNSHNRKYFLCESGKNKNALRKYYTDLGLDPKDVDKRCKKR